MFGEFCKVCLLLRIKPLTSVRGCFTFDHIGLKVKVLDASVRFYAAALGPCLK